MNTFELDSKYVAQTYRRFPVEIVSGKGAVAYDANGKKYIDMGSGIATNTFGYADSEWVAAVTEQLNCYSHTSNLYYTSPCAKLAEMLCERTGMCRVFFGNSGAEANEGAIKTARKYSFDKYGEGRAKIVTLQNSFHGRTITTLAATGQDVFHTTFMPFTEGFCHVPANDLDAMLAAMTDDVCAVMLEFVQGEGGVNPLDKDYVAAIAKACADKDILLIADEVQTGNGRTADHRNDTAVRNAQTNALGDFGIGQLHGVEELLHQFLVGTGGGFHQLGTQGLDLIGHGLDLGGGVCGADNKIICQNGYISGTQKLDILCLFAIKSGNNDFSYLFGCHHIYHYP